MGLQSSPEPSRSQASYSQNTNVRRLLDMSSKKSEVRSFEAPLRPLHQGRPSLRRIWPTSPLD
ncbi:hypothetical protein BJX64DRAFT_269264 [Aspergillus heterothallicus]